MHKGFSLIELLIGIGLVAVLIATVNVLLFSSLQSAKQAEAQGVTKTEGAYALNAMSQAIKFAAQIETCQPDSLTIRRLNNHRITYSIAGSGTSTRIASAGATLSGTNNVNLTSPIVYVTNCDAPNNNMFSCDASNRSVNICFKVNNSGGTSVNDSADVIFNTTVSVRNVDI